MLLYRGQHDAEIAGGKRVVTLPYLKPFLFWSLFLIVLAPFCTATAAPPPSVDETPFVLSLAWDPSPDTNIISYSIYFGGQSLVYTNVTLLGNHTAAIINGLVPGCSYYFAVTAKDRKGLESGFSNEFIYTIPGGRWVRLNWVPGKGLLLHGIAPAGSTNCVYGTSDFKTWSPVVVVVADENEEFAVPPLPIYLRYRFFRLQKGLPPVPDTTMEISY
jgi:hypothetical protein